MKPYLCIEWNDTESEAVGWLVIHNFVNGYTGGGIRMHPAVTREEVLRLAECMAYKYKAGESRFCGGCKGGIAYDSRRPDAGEVLRRYIIAMMPYIRTGVSLGGDYGTRYGDILKIFSEFGLDMPMTKSMRADPKIMENMEAYNRLLDETVYGRPLNDVIAGYGVACSADEAFAALAPGRKADVVIQGMGRVAFGCASRLAELGHRIVGMADSQVFVYCAQGLDAEALYRMKRESRVLDRDGLPEGWETYPTEACVAAKCDVLIPAALANTVNGDNAASVKAGLVVEAANIAVSPEADEILKKRGVRLICDFTANLSEAWLYDAVFFGAVTPELSSVLAGAEALCRRNAAKQMRCALEDGIYARESARELFEPDVQDLPEI